ncbi:MAG: hypothetical protein FIA92_05025 [Chloroflexi bacterium]|nr:hypothetical protein [Chloroflexota bacterium]
MPGGTVSLTDSDCEFEPPAGPIKPGLTEITFVNRSSARGGFHIWRLDAGHTFAELAAFIAEHLEGAERGVDTGPPPFAHQVTGPTLEPGGTDTWQLMTIEAVYGVACLAPNETARRHGMTREFVATYAAGPIVVGGSE